MDGIPMRPRFKPALVAFLTVFALLIIAVPPARAADCDRECLRGFISQYLNAMVAHTPASLATGDKFRFTENAVTMKLGEGLWKTASAVGTYRQDILDVRQGMA